MDNIDLSPHLIFKDKFNFDLDKINPIVEELMKDKNTGSYQSCKGESRTTHGISRNKQPHFHPHNKLFVNWLGERIRVIMKLWNEEDYPIFITNSWYNEHRQGGWQDDHVHALSKWSVSAYLDVPSNSGNILFRDPLHELMRNSTSESSQHCWRIVPVSTGDVVIFPSWLRHRTEVSESTDRRLVWSLNISYEKNTQEPILYL